MRAPDHNPLHELTQLLSETEHRVTRRLGRVLGQERSTVAQWRALALLADGEGHSMGELADVALLPAPSVTRLIDSMVTDGLVHRGADPRDRRRVLVYATRRGAAVHQRLAGRIDRERETILADGCEPLLGRLAALLGEFVDPPR